MDSVENIILREEVKNKKSYTEEELEKKANEILKKQIDVSVKQDKNEFYDVSEKDKIMNENVALTINRLADVMREIRRTKGIIDDNKREIEIIKKGNKKEIGFFEQNIQVGNTRKYNVPSRDNKKFDDADSFYRYEGDSFSRYEGDPRAKSYFKGKSEISKLQIANKQYEEVLENEERQMEQLESIIKTKTRFDFRIIKYIAGNKTLFLKSFAAVTGITILVLGTAIFLFFSFLSVDQRKKVLEKMREERKEEKEKGK